jgi:hypothetical protein
LGIFKENDLAEKFQTKLNQVLLHPIIQIRYLSPPEKSASPKTDSAGKIRIPDLEKEEKQRFLPNGGSQKAQFNNPTPLSPPAIIRTG